MTTKRNTGTAISAEQRRKVLALHGEGKGRNVIARATGVGAATVTKIIHEAGLTFDRTATKAATEAKQIDSRSRRAELAAILIDDAFRLRKQIWEPHEYIDHGGKDFDEARWTQDEPSPVDKLKLMQAASTALGRHIDLERHDADSQAADARSMLAKLGEALGVQKPDAA